jgi:predicted metal-dependent enzyme (double-stranded beta helix superfamily)
MTGYAFEQFTSDVDSLVRREKDPKALIQLVQPQLRALLAQRDWLDEQYRRPAPGKVYSQRLLYMPPDEAWTAVAFVWPRGATTPVHDHGTWGVIGVYQGQERETPYRIVEGSIPARQVRLVAERTRVMHPGDVSWVLPPNDVHCVCNSGQELAVSVHVYGTNIGKQARHMFELATGEVRDFVSGYDNA